MSGCGRGSIRDEDDNIRNVNSCVCEVVRAIKDIQDEAVEDECIPCLTSCFLEPLGTLVSPSRRNKRADTRVFTLQNDDGKLFHAFFKDENNPHDKDCISVFFRVEDVFDNCCATLRVLEPKDRDRKDVNLLSDDGSKINLGKLCKVENFERTDSCITVDLKCFCAVQCIKDVDLNICD
ncbi:CotY/CotZ family spore coat protein [Jeotgalibacillus soli]|uniref:Spore coat protein CotZ n=1 Tax=Jeotgalibacillus soli TaxID=889306 RepID=A0A0C2VNY2_9BACL|nr:CotY/CotZ family spore coat protein [Jeotgalibacillus soli]KIL45713.1 hypothetical protein KP78_20620 [Jeotgalibacillus soli]